jgi:hypothetical protein
MEEEEEEDAIFIRIRIIRAEYRKHLVLAGAVLCARRFN